MYVLNFQEEELSNLSKSSGDSSAQIAYVNEQLRGVKRYHDEAFLESFALEREHYITLCIYGFVVSH